MMRFSFTLVVVASLLALTTLSTQVDAHAKLNSPAAWNTKESKTGACGVQANAVSTNPADDYTKDTRFITANNLAASFNVAWQVTIGDGIGAITARLDTTGRVNPTNNAFTVGLTATGANTNPRVGTYNIPFTIPAGTQCTGPVHKASGKPTCTLQIKSTSNWVACATVILANQQPVPTQAPTTAAPATAAPATEAPTEVPTEQPTDASTTISPTTPVTAAPTAATLPPISDINNYLPYPSVSNNCMMASGLTTCSKVNNKAVQLMGTSFSMIEQQVVQQLDFNLQNPMVLERPNTPGCREALTDLLCAQMFPPCNVDATVVCQSTCLNVQTLCRPNATVITEGGTTSSHAELFDCNKASLGFNAKVSDSNGACLASGGNTDPPKAPAGTGRNQAVSLGTSYTVVMAVITLLVAFVGRL